MIDYKQLAIDCNTIAEAIGETAAGDKVTMRAEGMTAHQRACRDAILELLARAEKAETEAKQLGDQLVEAWRHLAFAVSQICRMDTECELCTHIQDLDSCEASGYDCMRCKADCHCRNCKGTTEGKSNWQFVGWDKAMVLCGEEK